MNLSQQISAIEQQFEIIKIIELGHWTADDYDAQKQQLIDRCKEAYRTAYTERQRVVFVHTGDLYVNDSPIGLVLRNLQVTLNEQDITASYCLILSTNPNIHQEAELVRELSVDSSNHFNSILINGAWDQEKIDKHPISRREIYRYGSVNPIQINLDVLSDRKKFLLADSKRFCIYPWIHLHAYPTGEAWPCCHAEMNAGPIGSVRQSSLEQIWNSERMKELRQDMLAERKNDLCVRCYEQEESGFFGGRQSANKHHGHHIDRIDATKPDGTFEDFHMTYWDIRFSNLCNLRCRSCGHIFSSQWYQDQAKLAGPEWARTHKVLNYAGKTETDIWQQLVPHLDYVEQIYFAGGEPLMMEEHYNILEELERRGRFDVRLIYNTNFTHVRLKDRLVFDYWKKFKNVAVGASLDAMGSRAEYIRKGTDWQVIEENRQKMLEICPEVDFYISPTLSLYNAWHLPDFHRDWVARGFIRKQDLNVNVLQDPDFMRVDIAPMQYKERLREKFEQHLQWLQGEDHLGRATQGFRSVITFMMADDKTHLLDKFKRKTKTLDDLRGESLLDVIPELEILYHENTAP